MILDLMLPHVHGYQVCQKLRAAGNDAPIILLSARSAEPDVVMGLDVGADDYVTKPFRPREVMARVQAMMRRPRRSAGAPPPAEAAPAPAIEIGALRIDVEAREVSLDDDPVPLTRTEVDVLAFVR